SLGNDTIQRAQAQWQAKQANAQYEATQAGAFGANAASQTYRPSFGNQGPPGPPRPPRHATFGDLPDDSGREEANRFLQNLTIQVPPVHLSKPPSYDGKDLSKFRPWWYKVEAYLDTYASGFVTDNHKINWI
ncbi:hypothetical protein N0V85_009939, partial [Neurospora sp. IMI 360204]